MTRPQVLPPADAAPPTGAAIAVVVRVYDRMADLDVALDLIRRRWTRRPVHVIVASNGLTAGHAVSDAARGRADQVVEIADNPGREAGAARLILDGVARVPAGIRHVVLLESDAWVLDDRVLDRHLTAMERSGAAWTSARWIERWSTRALDLALADVRALRAHPGWLDGPELEARVAGGLADAGLVASDLLEAMPVHRPRLLARLGLGSRRHCFPALPMVTHHVEDLRGGIVEKMAIANACAGTRVFDVADAGDRWRRGRIALDEFVSRIAPRSSWWTRPRRRRLHAV